MFLRVAGYKGEGIFFISIFYCMCVWMSNILPWSSFSSSRLASVSLKPISSNLALSSSPFFRKMFSTAVLSPSSCMPIVFAPILSAILFVRSSSCEMT